MIGWMINWQWTFLSQRSTKTHANYSSPYPRHHDVIPVSRWGAFCLHRWRRPYFCSRPYKLPSAMEEIELGFRCALLPPMPINGSAAQRPASLPRACRKSRPSPLHWGQPSLTVKTLTGLPCWSPTLTWESIVATRRRRLPPPPPSAVIWSSHKP